MSKEPPTKKRRREPFRSYAEALATAEEEGARIVEQVRVRGELRLNVVKGKRPETWRVRRPDDAQVRH